MAQDFDRAAHDAPVPDDLAADGVSAAAAQVLRQVLDPSAGRSAGRDAEAAFARVARETGPGVGMRGQMRGLGRWTFRSMVWSLGALSVAVAAFLVLSSRSRPSSLTTKIYATGANQEGILTLSDGTRVTLLPGTTLRLAGFSPQTQRTVEVDGKAYFEVIHTTGVPFQVRSGTVTTQVLGTSFLVDHVPHSARVRIAVEEGKVRMVAASRMHADLAVTAGHVGEITDSLATVSAVVDSAAGTDWLRGQLVFRHRPVAVVLQTLGRWYGYQFRCSDSTLPQRNVTIGLSIRSSSSALATLEQILQVNLTVTGDTVTLTPQGERRVKGMPRVRSYDIWTPIRGVGR